MGLQRRHAISTQLDAKNMKETYEHRFTAFVDILGFKQMIAQIETKSLGHEALLERLKSVLNFLNEESIESDGQHDLLVYELTDDGMIERELGDPRITYVSDCAIVSTQGTFDGFKSICNKLSKLSTDLACDGMFLRGAITYGPLYHDRKFVFGSAYQQAYEIESKVAVFPRIVIDSSALDFLAEYEGRFPLTNHGTRLDADGHRYLRVFPYQFFPYYTSNWLGFLLRVKGKILASLNTFDKRINGFPPELKQLDTFYCWREMVGGIPDFSGADDKVLAKYLWLKDEFNRTLDEYAEHFLGPSDLPRIAKIIDLETHWGPEQILGRLR